MIRRRRKSVKMENDPFERVVDVAQPPSAVILHRVFSLARYSGRGLG
jgi:hypothetical protein